jgi:peptidoglycan/LPS O-acetylase OafA/YrhL
VKDAHFDAPAAPPSGLEAFRSTKYFPALDGLRCFSIAAVIWHHSTPRQMEGIAGRGHLGVRLFFCISGLLITMLLLRERRSSGTVNLSRFWMRRCLRIFPLYYAVLLLFTLFALHLPVSSAVRGHFIQSLPYYASHTSNWFVNYGVPHAVLFGFAWSLSTEEQFYLCLPLLIKKLTGRIALGLTLVVLIVVDQLTERHLLSCVFPRHSRLEIIVTSFMASIGFGALLAVLLDDKRGFEILKPLLARKYSAPILLCLIVTWLVRPPQQFVLFEAALALFVAACALGGDFTLVRAFALRPLCHVGRVSYGMYLFHVPVIGALRHTFPSIAQRAAMLFPVALIVTVGLATLSHRTFEAFFLAMRPRAGEH